MKRQIRLAHKLIVLVILTTGVAVAVPSMLVIQRGGRALADKVGQLMASEAERGRQQIEMRLDDYARAVRELHDELSAADQSVAQREIAVRGWFRRNPDALEVGFERPDDGTLWRSPRQGAPLAEQLQCNVSTDGFRPFHGVLAGHEDSGDKADRLVLKTGGSAPQLTIVVSKWRLSTLNDELRKIKVGQTGHVLVVDQKGHLLAHPLAFGEDQTSGSPYRIGRNLSNLDIVRKLLPGGKAFSQDSSSRGLDMHYTNEDGNSVVAKGATVEGLGWVVIAQMPEQEAMADVESMKRQVLLWGTTTGLIAVLLGLAIVGQITKPLETLVEATNRVGAGDLMYPVGLATRDEIGLLALAFNEMQIRLRDTYQKLENIVAERTHELQETTDFLNSVLDSSTEYSIIATDLYGIIVSYNEGSRRVYGYDPEEIIGAPGTILFPRDTEDRRCIESMLEQARAEGSYSGEAVHVRKGRHLFPVRVVISLRYDDSGEPVGYTTISRDITAEKNLEARIKEYTENLETLVASKTTELQETNRELQRANNLKAEFLSSMSHELRTPLNAIIGFGDVLQDELVGELNDQQKECIGDILSSGHQLLNLINDILDLSKVEAGRMTLTPEMVELAVVFDEVQTIIQGLAVRKGLSLAFREEPVGIFLTTDRVKLLQILYNLLSNAVKFTSEGGSVRVEARKQDEGICFRVIDNGMGIPKEKLEVIFEEFRQVDSRLSREYGGTGLGLALTKKLVELHGGTVSVESQVDKGSVFTFTIPHTLPVESCEPEIFAGNQE